MTTIEIKKLTPKVIMADPERHTDFISSGFPKFVAMTITDQGLLHPVSGNLYDERECATAWHESRNARPITSADAISPEQQRS